MPKVKFSALVSDMKGKSQGSVFSTNSGGAYFRNNPSGGGRKSATWQAQKNSFSVLASQWKSLTLAQQIEWNDMGPSYPTTNAFGDQRIPSGYELFMRLNGTLSALNLPTLVTPVAPNSFPVMDDVEWGAPDNYQFHPQRLFNPEIQNVGTLWAMNPTYFLQKNLELNIGLYPRFVIDPAKFDTLSSNNWFSIISIISEDIYGIWAWIQRKTETICRVYIVSNVLDDLAIPYCQIRSYDILTTDMFPSCLFGLSGSFIADDASPLIVGLESYAPNSTEWYKTHVYDPTEISSLTSPESRPSAFISYASADASLFIGHDPKGFKNIGSLSDFRILSELDPATFCDPSDILLPTFSCASGEVKGNFRDPVLDKHYAHMPINRVLLAYNYVIGNEMCLYGFDKAYKSEFTNFGADTDYPPILISTDPECTSAEDCTMGGYYSVSEVECDNGVCIYAGDLSPQFVPSPLTSTPFVVIKAQDTELTGFVLAFESTLPMSAGRNPLQQRYKRIGSYDLQTPGLLLSPWLSNVFGGVPDNSSLALKFVVVDSTTGQANDTQLGVAKPPRSIRRFKAGAELSGKVN